MYVCVSISDTDRLYGFRKNHYTEFAALELI